ncbi:hypothetical protein XENOCAPTIV_017068 [Xenoophorus captivus]|uniref:Uncharacterized protein n=1 Tax=Xenoophorus captivus TaxID=1517983 RepID=A0ABV0QDJ5_9TELE
MQCMIQESMFRTLMKWSNIYVPDLRSLEERLICMEVSGVNEQIVMMVMKEVASLATFVNFLPLANRIYIEMAESTGASKVVQNLSVCTLSEQHKAWKQVGRVERLTCRKKRLKDCRKIAVKLEQGTMTVYTEGIPLKSPTKSPQLLCGRMDEESATRSAPPDGSLLPSDKGTGHPQIDLGILKTLKEVILQHKHEQRRSTLMREISSESGSKSESSSSAKQTTKEMQSSCLSSATEDISESAKECKSYASSSGSTKRSLSSSSLSLSVKTKKHTLESTKSQTNPSSFADGSETVPSLSSSKPGKSLVSSGEKDLSNKTETSLRASPQPSTSTGRNTCSSSTSAETSQSDKNKLTGGAMANGDHEVSAQSCTAKTQSDSKLVKSSEASPAAQGQNSEFTYEIQNQECFKDKNVDVNSPMKEGPDNESYQITDSVTGQKDKQNSDTETPGTEKSKILCQEGLQVSKNIEDSKKALNKLEMETFLDAKDNATEKEYVAVKDENCLAKNEGSTVKPDQKIKASTGEEGETLPIKQESSDKLLQIQTTDSSAETGTGERTEELVYKDSVSPTQRSFGRSKGGAKQDETNQDIVATDEQTITTRSTRERMENTEKDSSDGRKDNTPRQRRHTPTRDSQEQNKDRSLKGEEEMPAIDVTPTTCKQKPTQVISDDFRETKEEHKEAVTRRKRGRPKKTAGLLPPGAPSTCLASQSGRRCYYHSRRFTSLAQHSGRHTRSSSAAVKRCVETHQSQENEPKPAERAGVKSGRKVTTERKSAKTVPVLDPPGPGQESEVHKAETPISRMKKSLQVSHSINKEVQICSQSAKDAKEKEIATDDHEASLQEEKHLVKDEGLAVKPSQETRFSKSEDGENSPKKPSPDKQPETQTKDSSAETETDNGPVEMVCKESVKNKSGKERSFSHTARLAKQNKTNEDKAATNAPAVTTRSTSRRRKVTEKDSAFERKKDKTLTRRRKTNPGDSQHQNKEKTQKTEQEMLPKDDTPGTCEQKPPQEISEDVNFRKNGEEEKEPATKRKRGRPKKTAGPSPGE